MGKDDEYFNIILGERVKSITRVFDNFGIDNFYISYSGGKDSNVLDKLIDVAVPNNHIPRVFMHTGLELNAVVDFVKDKVDSDYRLHIITPKTNIRNCLEEYGYPFKSKNHAKRVDTYQRKGMTNGIKNYLTSNTKFSCPKKLRYQFTDENKLKISAACCVYMKEIPLYQ